MPPAYEPVQLPPIWKRPTPLLIGISVAAVLAAIASKYFDVRYSIVADPISGSHAQGLQGGFHLIRWSRFDGKRDLNIDWIRSDRSAGACLVFRPQDLGYSKMAAIQNCTLNSQCYTDELPDAGAGYCHQGTCWAKPTSAGLCNKGEIRNVDETYPVPTQPPAKPLPVPRGSTARIVACINQIGIDPFKTGCGSKDGTQRVEVFGDPFVVN